MTSVQMEEPVWQMVIGPDDTLSFREGGGGVVNGHAVLKVFAPQPLTTPDPPSNHRHSDPKIGVGQQK